MSGSCSGKERYKQEICGVAIRTLHIFIPRRCTRLARVCEYDAQATTNYLQDGELLTRAVGRRLYEGKVGRDNDALEISALRTRITEAHASSGAIVELWHEVVHAAKDDKK